jgi:hypothetical protein
MNQANNLPDPDNMSWDYPMYSTKEDCAARLLNEVDRSESQFPFTILNKSRTKKFIEKSTHGQIGAFLYKLSHLWAEGYLILLPPDTYIPYSSNGRLKFLFGLWSSSRISFRQIFELESTLTKLLDKLDNILIESGYVEKTPENLEISSIGVNTK